MPISELHLTVAVNDEVRDGFEPEHGLCLVFRESSVLPVPLSVGSVSRSETATSNKSRLFLFDLGAGKTTLAHLSQLGVDLTQVHDVLLSHGHYDHTGGLVPLLDSGITPNFWFVPGIDIPRYRVEQNPTEVHEISMPPTCRARWGSLPSSFLHPVPRIIPLFTNEKNVSHREGSGECRYLLTGPIPRFSAETAGGAFFLDSEGTIPDDITDEQSLLVRLGSEKYLLVTGCCHAGLMNTVEYCRKNGFRVETVFGGLHLNRATPERLRQTVEYLHRTDVKRLILTHCTGVEAGRYLAEHFDGEVITAKGGDTFRFILG